MTEWISVAEEGPPNFIEYGFQTRKKMLFKAPDGEHEGLYWGWGVFFADGKGDIEDSYDVGVTGDHKVTHWMPILDYRRRNHD